MNFLYFRRYRQRKRPVRHQPPPLRSRENAMRSLRRTFRHVSPAIRRRAAPKATGRPSATISRNASTMEATSTTPPTRTRNDRGCVVNASRQARLKSGFASRARLVVHRSTSSMARHTERPSPLIRLTRLPEPSARRHRRDDPASSPRR